MNCPHLHSARIAPPTHTTKVYKEECTLCFDSQDDLAGIDVCLTCFNGGCPPETSEHAHSLLHYQKSNHPLVMNVRRKKIERQKRTDESGPPPPKITKVAINPLEQEDQYEYLTTVKCFECGGIEVDKNGGKIPGTIAGIMSAMSAQQQSDVKAWEEEINKCQHTENLQQIYQGGQLEGSDLAHCSLCDLKENLWLCLVCGNLGCGRAQYGSNIAGNGHALQHFNDSKHAVTCKLGTITPEGTADIYCYDCNDAKVDPKLGEHLSKFGINITGQTKTEKSMAELQLEQNLKFDFSMTTDDGKQLEPLYGPGFTGLKNLGNSCYMASVIQSVFALEGFRERYASLLAAQHSTTCHNDPSSCFHCQMCKIADGLYSGRYSASPCVTNDETKPPQKGIPPSMFKNLIGRNHPEFSTMRQQDAHEFFQHFVKTVEQKERAEKSDPTEIFKFAVEQRLQCMECRKVRYMTSTTTDLSVGVPVRRKKRELTGDVEMEKDGSVSKEVFEPVRFEECLDMFVAKEMVPGWNCPSCKRKTVAVKSQSFGSFPEILVVHVRRFELENWVPKKLNIPITVPEGTIDLEKYRAHGKQADEELLPEEAAPSAEPSVDADAVAQLMGMGFPEVRCKRALIKTGNNGADVAMNWLFEHMDDADIDDPIESAAPSGQQVSEGEISMLADMGFTTAQAKKALRETSNDMERAVEWLFSHPEVTGLEDDTSVTGNNSSEIKACDPKKAGVYSLCSFVSHKGTSVHCGHYVTHVRKEEKAEWVLFNDERVVEVPKAPVEEAYMYLFGRV